MSRVCWLCLNCRPTNLKLQLPWCLATQTHVISHIWVCGYFSLFYLSKTHTLFQYIWQWIMMYVRLYDALLLEEMRSGWISDLIELNTKLTVFVEAVFDFIYIFYSQSLLHGDLKQQREKQLRPNTKALKWIHRKLGVAQVWSHDWKTRGMRSSSIIMKEHFETLPLKAPLLLWMWS